MKHIFFSFIFIFISLGLNATIQEPDKILIDNIKYDLCLYPLEEYFQTNNIHPPHESLSTGLWRGYMATLVIHNKNLYISDIEINTINDKKGMRSALEETFGSNNEVFMNWYTGYLIVRINNESYKIYLLEKGTIYSEQLLNFDKLKSFRTKQYDEYKKTNKYKLLYNKYKDNGYEDDYIEKIIWYSFNDESYKLYKSEQKF